jgi:hypothetical protein
MGQRLHRSPGYGTTPARAAAAVAAVSSATMVDITPEPTAEEAAAIAAALAAWWPSTGRAQQTVRRPSAWRFSGRWWSQPVPVRRARPWI